MLTRRSSIQKRPHESDSSDSGGAQLKRASPTRIDWLDRLETPSCRSAQRFMSTSATRHSIMCQRSCKKSRSHRTNIILPINPFFLRRQYAKCVRRVRVELCSRMFPFFLFFLFFLLVAVATKLRSQVREWQEEWKNGMRWRQCRLVAIHDADIRGKCNNTIDLYPLHVRFCVEFRMNKTKSQKLPGQ